MNRVDRLLAIILFLQSRPLSTAGEMSEHFGLSIRTIYRDLAALGEAGVPITAQAGMGYSLAHGYHLPPVSFTTEEATALVTGGLLVDTFADASLRSRMHSALMKIRAVLPRNLQVQINRLDENMATTARSAASGPNDLLILQEALAQRRVLRFQYQGWGQAEPALREVEPLGLLYYLERWHLISWCRQRQDYRDFRMDRMSRITTLQETFTPPEEFSLSDYVGTMPQPELKAVVKFSRESGDRAMREWWMGFENPSVNGKDTTLTLLTVSWESLTGWLLSFGSDATVLEPPELREKLIQLATGTAEHHRNSSAC